MENTHKKCIAIVNVDSILGCCVAMELAQKLEKECKEVELHCLAKKIDHLDRLKKMKNVKLVKIDYNDEKCLHKAMERIHCTILMPEMCENRAKNAKNLICAMLKEKVGGILMVSAEGSESEGLRELNSFHEIERCIQDQHWEQCYLILRKSILNQCFMLWGPAVKEHGEFPLTCEKGCELAPLDACDLTCAIESIVVHYCRHGNPSLSTSSSSSVAAPGSSPFGEHRNKIYTLTGPNKITAEGIVHELNQATGQNVKFKPVSHDELRRYLESLKERQGFPEEDDINPDHDHHHDYAPNEATIRLLLDELALIERGEASFVSGDLEKIIGHKGKTMSDFFKKEKDSFKK
ncbi:hypothetical protein BG004_004739 [Podila humilis]|nr:hypothetical protein BG004_004739 [Podila humilis]